MSDINFLNKNSGHAEKKDAKKEIKMEWSRPDKEKSREEKKEKNGGKFFNFLPFFKRHHLSVDKAEEKNEDKIYPPAHSFPEQNRGAFREGAELKHSREEVLKLIRETEEKETPREGKKRNSWGLLFLKLFGLKKKNGREVLVDSWGGAKERKKEARKENTIKISPLKERAVLQVKTKEIKPFSSLVDKARRDQTLLITRFANFWRRFLKNIKKMGRKTYAPDLMSVKEEAKKKKEEIIRFTEIKEKTGEKKTETVPSVEKEAIEEKEKEKEKKEEKEEGESDILETSLIKEEIISFFDWRRNITTFVSFVILACLIVGGAFWGIAIWGKNKKEEGINFALEAEKIAREIAKEEKGIKEITAFQDKLKLVIALLDRHVYWTNFFKFLEDNTLTNVYYVSFGGENKGKYEIEAKAANFNAIAEQLKVMKENSQVIQAEASGGKVSAAAGSKGSVVDFILKLLVLPDLFKK